MNTKISVVTVRLITNYLIWKLLLMATLLIMVVTIFDSQVMALDPVSSECYGFRGQTTMTSSSAVDENEGQFNFELPVPGDDYKACIHTQPSGDEIELKGWVWNLNLGWVSLHSSDEDGNAGTPLTNQGVPTGSIEYESHLDLSTSVKTDGDYVDAELFGNWWGDNLGWLRLNSCDSPGVSCGAVPYGVKIATIDNMNTDEAMGNLTGYAWSTAHGWVNMEGVRIPLGYLHAEYIPSVSFFPSAQVGYDWDEENGERIARSNGLAGYKMAVRFRNKAGNLVSLSDLPVDLKFCFIWDDKRYLDYREADIHPAEQEECYNPGSQPSDQELAMTFAGTDKGVDQSGFVKMSDYFYQRQPMISLVPAGIGEFSLKQVMVSSNSTNKKYDIVDKDLVFRPPYDLKVFQEILDEGEDCLSHVPQDNNLNTTLGFNDSFTVCGNYLASGLISREVKVKLDYSVVEVPDSDSDIYITYFDRHSPPFRLCPVEVTNEEGETTTFPANWLLSSELVSSFRDTFNEAYVVHLGFNNVAATLGSPSFEGMPGADGFGSIPDLGVEDFDSDIGARADACEAVKQINLETYNVDSVIEEAEADLLAVYDISSTGETVIRKAAVLESPDLTVSAASFSGNIQGDAIQVFKDDASVSSGGESVRNEQRKTIIKSTTDLLKGKTLGCRFKTPGSLPSDYESCKVNDDLYLIEFTKEYINALGLTHLGQLPIIEYSDLPDDFKEGNKTLVLIGSSLLIDKDIETEAKGFVVLKNSARTGGHIYIAPKVTDIRAHIYADGTIYSLDSVDVDTVKAIHRIDGFPSLEYRPDKSKLRNQLYIAGQITSQNTYGGALSSTPRLGSGVIVDPADIALAKWQDLNFWRYSPATLDTRSDEVGEYYQLCGQEGEGALRPFFGDDKAYLVKRDNHIEEALEREDLGIDFLKCWPTGEEDKRLSDMYTESDDYLRYNVSPVMIQFRNPPKDLPLFK